MTEQTIPRRFPIRVQEGKIGLDNWPWEIKMGPGGSNIGPESPQIDSWRVPRVPTLTSETPARHLRIPECSRRAPRCEQKFARSGAPGP